MRSITIFFILATPFAVSAQEVENHPILTSNTNWVPIVLLLIGLLGFLAAAVIGPIVRLNMPEELPAAHSHDEPPGASHHHGASGLKEAEHSY